MSADALNPREQRRLRRQQRREARRAARAAAAQQSSKATEAEEKRRAVLDEKVADAVERVVKPTGFVPATAPDLGGYAVFANANRRSAIRVALDGGIVEYIPLTDEALKVDRCSEAAFKVEWTRAEYVPKRAAEAYAAAARWRGITEEAKLHLEHILGKPLKNLKTQVTTKEKAMRKRTSPTVPASSHATFITDDTASAPGTAPGGAAPHSPTETQAHKDKVAAGKSKGKPKAKSKKAAPKKAAPKKAAKKSDDKPTGKRAEMHAKRIKVLISKNPKREGTKAWKKFEVYKTAKTVGEALEKGAKVGYKMSTLNYDVKHKFIQLVS